MNDNPDARSNPGFYISFAACFCFIFIGFYELIKTLKKAPKIIISKDSLIIHNQEYQLTDIVGLKLTGKYYFSSGGRYNIKELMFREGMEIKFTNGDTLHLFDQFYNNLNELKILLKKRLQSATSSETVDITNQKQNIKYRNNQFFKLRGIILWSIIIYLLIKNIFLTNNENLSGVILVLSICLLLFFWQSRHMHFFIFENGELIVKNENFLWKNKKFNLKDIEEVVFEKDIIIPDFLKTKHLRIILKNHKQFRYGADLLRKDMWNEMKQKFKVLDINVRDEF